MKILLIIIILLSNSFSFAKAGKNEVPRFMTIKSSEANVRKGPGVQYPTTYVYHYRWLPIEVISEYEQWRLIRDKEGAEGWIHSSILSSKRSVIINSLGPENLYKTNKINSRIVAKLMPGVACSLNKCDKSWCKIKCSEYTGWISRNAIWGIYRYEEW